MLFKENIHPHFLIEITEIEIEGPFILIFLSSSFFLTKPFIFDVFLCLYKLYLYLCIT